MIGLVFIIIVGMLSLVLFMRNERVYGYRIGVLHRLHDQAGKDISSGDYDYIWRYEEFRSVSYNAMMLRPWKRLDSFYPRDPARPER